VSGSARASYLVDDASTQQEQAQRHIDPKAADASVTQASL
jgi:hypothetical protein